MKRLLMSVCFVLMVFGVYGRDGGVKIERRGDGTYSPEFSLAGKKLLSAPAQGLWAVATDWTDGWMGGWVYGKAVRMERTGDWTVLSGTISLPQGEMEVRDAYRDAGDGLVRCLRRYEWTGKDTLKRVNLSVRWQLAGDRMKPFIPGMLYYGNPSGAKINPDVIPVYYGKEGEFAIFEEHRYPMPFAVLEETSAGYAAALHATPSPVRGAVLSDQWWSLGVETFRGFSELVMYSGPVGYNGQRGVVKALQQTPMKYGDTYLNMEPGQVVEKEFFVELYPTEAEGTGFQRPVYTSIRLHQPFDADRFAPMEEIVRSKYQFAQSRWMEDGDKAGFGMYDTKKSRDLVMGWCGQAASPGFALQMLGKYLDDNSIPDKVQRSLDFLTTYPVDGNGMFPVGCNLNNGKFFGGDNVSCGQAMFNFAKAIEVARKNKKYDTQKWEAFLKKACDGQAVRILRDDWTPVSTAEGFYIAPLAIASKLFKNDVYKKAALKAADVFASRHLTMREPYWGGTLDATCEDKEGAWAAFQGFSELYAQFKDKKHLVWAKHAMDVCLSYAVVWDIPLPAGRLADHNFKTMGWTGVSPQNQHIDVFGVFFTPDVYRMGVWLKDENLKKFARVMFRSCFQLTDAWGSQGEQVQQTNFAQRGDMSNVYKLRGGYAETWTVFWITGHFLNAAARFEQMGVDI